ncbi:Glycerophosphodiester phosphodiesterase GDPD3 [Hibiscus syriacus]|uniref:glycerophosphodiester phosphodiesterase n=1 Tax=Hibiscus syriacus TaxID=106335 RepID=A0A6A2Y848_HIBSY|nr:Glycerophosphodiester phosphodiesterase GDPD3 [Hibiscus syriacus]
MAVLKAVHVCDVISIKSRRMPLQHSAHLVSGQVTKDDYPVIYHDNFIHHEEKGAIVENRVTELTLTGFLSYGPQKLSGTEGKPIFRKLKNGSIFGWKVDQDAPLRTLEEAFQNVDRSLGFNVELKFDDLVDYTEEQLTYTKSYLEEGRAVMFSSFQPDAARLIRKLQSAYPVYFLTNGGTEIYTDVRRNSLARLLSSASVMACKGSYPKPELCSEIPEQLQESKLSLVTYGQLNVGCNLSGGGGGREEFVQRGWEDGSKSETAIFG